MRAFPGSLGRGVQVEITEAPSNSWGGTVAFERDGRVTSRQVTGEKCDEVVVALALITSLWLEPRAAEPRSAPFPAPAPRDDGAPDVDVESGATALPDAVERRDLAAPLARESISPASEPRESGETNEPATIEVPVAASVEEHGSKSEASAPVHVQLVGLVSYGTEPDRALDGRLQIELFRGTGASNWLLATGLGYAVGRAESERLGSADLAWLTGQLGLCPPGVALAGHSWVRVCAQARAGGLRFAPPTAHLQDAAARWRPSASMGVGLHSGVPLAGGIGLRLFAEASLLLVRDEFVTEPSAASAGIAGSSPFHQPDLISLNLGLGIAHAF